MKIALLSVLISLSASVFTQTTIDKTIVSNGVTRAYKLYIPASYSSGTPVPLVFNFHGLGGTNLQQMFYGDFRPIADTANFIIVHPQGLPNATLGGAYWNAYFGGPDDDFAFVKNLIDTISSNYSINPNRIHSTGMSNGGYMSLALAAEFDGLFASVASVTGTMVLNFPVNANNNQPISVMQIHGTNDATVGYFGNASSMSIANVLNYWIAHNSANTAPVRDSIPNINLTDGCYANRYTHGGGMSNTEVIHYKITNGAHTWPGSPFVVGVTNQDFNASEVIWQFFDKHPNSRPVSIDSYTKEELEIKFFYNEMNKEINLTQLAEKNSQLHYTIFSMDGKTIAQGQFNETNKLISTESFQAAGYVVRVVDADKKTTVSFKFVVK